MKLLATLFTTIHGVSLPPSLSWFNSYCDLIPCDRSAIQVCGTDGITYTNECERIRESCRQGTLATSGQAHVGPCAPPPCEMYCPRNYDPVCGSDGVTYNNGCELENANCNSSTTIEPKYSGECKRCPACMPNPMFMVPVCGEDGKTYSSECELTTFNCENNLRISIAHEGECEQRMPCPICMPMADEYNPVCGSDGATYDSECMLALANCNKPISQEITKLHNGRCSTRPRCPPCMANPAFDRALCGSDDRTYSNHCELTTYNCENNLNISVAYNGTCKSDNPCPICPEIYRPVCGNDGTTYSSECHVAASNCRNYETVIIDYKGECQPRLPCPDCRPEYGVEVVLCGSDGKTYDSHCSLATANCNKLASEEITKLHDGPCRITKTCPLCMANPAYDRPLCGDDGNTYSSQCQLTTYNCENNLAGTPRAVSVAYEGRCVTCPVCPTIHEPVCGSDGKTYSNECRLNAAACENGGRTITVDYPGECQRRLPCPRCVQMEGVQPVCGSDGITYESDCMLTTANCNKLASEEITKLHDGACKSPCPLCMVHPTYMRPVCGEDNKTYDSQCTLTTFNCESGQNISVAHDGPCRITKTCPLCMANPAYDRPLCGDDGNTYSSQCQLTTYNCENDLAGTPRAVSVAYEGECRTRCPICREDYQPVCGSDGKTYGNTCKLESAACHNGGRTITIDYPGECQRRLPCPLCVQMEGAAVQPVCGSDNVTYESDCMLTTANCNKLESEEITKLHDGACKAPCPLCMVHPKYMRPVCGEDNITYDSQCTLTTFNCKSGQNIAVAHEGECRMATPAPQPCPKCATYDQPVCGSDGNTYRNDCFLMAANCNNFGELVTKEHDGQCRTRTDCTGYCPRLYDPVCGTDGVTYNSECELTQAACKSPLQMEITVRHSGRCSMWGGFGDFFNALG